MNYYEFWCLRGSRYSKIANGYIQKAYLWMFAGLMITSVTAYLVSQDPDLYNVILGNDVVFYGLLIVQFLAIVFIAAFIKRISDNLAGSYICIVLLSHWAYPFSSFFSFFNKLHILCNFGYGRYVRLYESLWVCHKNRSYFCREHLNNVFIWDYSSINR